MAQEESKAPQPVARRQFNGYKLGNGKQAIDITTKYGGVRITNESLQQEKMVALVQRHAPVLFQNGTIVLA